LLTLRINPKNPSAIWENPRNFMEIPRKAQKIEENRKIPFVRKIQENRPFFHKNA
jgi:hypothetical protein